MREWFVWVFAAGEASLACRLKPKEWSELFERRLELLADCCVVKKREEQRVDLFDIFVERSE